MPNHMRFARVQGSGISEEGIAAYLPANYSVIASSDAWVDIAGRDDAGWTMDGYVIPRLRSGLFFAKETTADREYAEELEVTAATERKHGMGGFQDDWAMEYERY